MAIEDVYRVPGSAPKRRQRVYQQWQGNETFFCWGYLVAGPNWRASLGTAFLLLAPAGIFLAFVAPYVAMKTHVIILVFSCILPALCALFLFLTACRDPGIIPRQEPDEEYLAGRKPRTQEVQVNGHRVIIRYNDTCHFYQPPRAHHCSVNDNCIERFDHHCPWVGTTIGKRNYRTFLLFVYTATVLCLYVIGVSLGQLFLKHKELVDDDEAAGGDGSGQWGHTVRDVIPALVLMSYCFLFLWFVGGLSGFHCYLTATNQTTYENFRYNHDNRPNPFNRGIWNNCAEVWCTRVPTSQVDFRAYIDEMKPKPGSMELAPHPYQPPNGAGMMAAGPAGAGYGPDMNNNGVYHTPLYAGGTVQTSSYHQPQPGYVQQPHQQYDQLPAAATSSFAVQAPAAGHPLARAEAFVPPLPQQQQVVEAGGSGLHVGAAGIGPQAAWHAAADRCVEGGAAVRRPAAAEQAGPPYGPGALG